MIAQRTNTTQEKLIAKIVDSEGPIYFSKCPPPNREAAGPERFYFDESSYTGRHRDWAPEHIDAYPNVHPALLVNKVKDADRIQSMRVEHMADSPERRKVLTSYLLFAYF